MLRFIFATDDNYWMHTYVAIHSLICNNSSSEIEIYVLCESVNAEFQKNIGELKLINENASVKFIVLNEALEKIENFKVCHHITKATYYRFFIEKLFPNDVDKLVYLDSDIIVNSSLSELCNVDLQHHLLAAVPQVNTEENITRLGLPPGSKYFNAGVLVINLKKWREHNVSHKLMQYSEENQDIIEWGDQDCLNAVASGQWLELPKEFNFYHGFINNNFDEHRHIKPSIIHYSGRNKPWRYRGTHPYKKLYWDYLRQTPYRSYVPSDLTPLNIIKSVVPKRLRGKFRRVDQSIEI